MGLSDEDGDVGGGVGKEDVADVDGNVDIDREIAGDDNFFE